MKWIDVNGNEHIINPHMELQMQQPNCKYLLPCGICTLFSDLHTCDILKEAKKNENTNQDTV